MLLLSCLFLTLLATNLTAIPVGKEANSLPLGLFVTVNTTNHGLDYLPKMMEHIQNELNVTVVIEQIMPLYVTSEDVEKKQTDLSGVELKIITSPGSEITIRDVEDSAYDYYFNLDQENVFHEITRSLPKAKTPKSDNFWTAVFLFCVFTVILLIYSILKWTGYPNQDNSDRIDYT
ncbi:unnamed protein product [Bursaphelenchus xylophilus]|uniref:(pine wood nematode) hypothetical protein n=1 Tax=Bursaphelenchus xylophilus TaxID=6326 RepID=A0A1I7RLT5_BURXY|nr:unnamed protein product [Bursaphelenchus xylophilus]CAG9106270.1 unnamed protein product [Bursaphelenchus xylophilus]